MAEENLKVGWLLVAFDLPVLTKPQRKIATGFRKFLLDDGYQMIQFSVYVRACVSFARQGTHLSRVTEHLPPEGTIRAIFITRAQWDKSFLLYGSPAKKKKTEEMPEQLQFW